MDILTQISIGQWSILWVSIFLFLGPGLLMSALLRLNRYFDLSQQFIVSFALSLAIFTIVLAWLNAFSLSLSPPAFVWLLVGCWLLFLARLRSSPASVVEQVFGYTKLGDIVFWGSVLLITIIQLSLLNGVVVQPGSDGYHHTLIAQEIAEQGGLPNDLLPLTPVVTFTYHYGYHAFVAAIHWLTGIPVVAATPVVAQLLKVGAALSAALIAEVISRHRYAGIVTLLVVGLISVFPSFYVNWGRNTQLTGLLMLGVLMASLWLWAFRGADKRLVVAIALLATGTALAHYRVTLMAVIGCSYIVVAALLMHRWSLVELRARVKQIIAMGILALIFTSPWLWHIWDAQTVGYSAKIGQPALGFYQLDRLGATVLDYPTNWPVIGASVLALIWGIWRRLAGVLVMAAWVCTLLLLSLPWAAGQYMDTITIITSAFLPLGVMIGVAGTDFVTDSSAARWRLWIVTAIIMLFTLVGAVRVMQVVEPGSPYVLTEDLAAAEWIAENTPETALFMVNTFTFDFLPELVVASDAGGWLPVLARRAVVTAPMIYSVERVSSPEYLKKVNSLANLGGNLTSDAAMDLLRRAGVTHVYVGARGGPINPTLLLSSPHFKLEYHQDNVYVFSLRDDHLRSED